MVFLCGLLQAEESELCPYPDLARHCTFMLAQHQGCLFTVSLTRAMTACLHYISSRSPNIPGPHVAQMLSSNGCGRRKSWEGKKENSKFYF